MTRDNLRRFGLHLLFGALAAGAQLLVSDIGRLHLDPTTVVVVTALGTSAASFFRKQADANQ